MKTKKRNPLIIIFFMFLMFLSSSCTHYFNVIIDYDRPGDKINEYAREGRYIVLRRGEEALHIYDITMVNDSLFAKSDFSLGYLSNYLNPKINKLNSFKIKQEPEVPNTVHIFTSDTSYSALDSTLAIPLRSIYGMHCYKYNKKASVTSFVVPIVVVATAGTILFVTLVAISISNAANSLSSQGSWHIK